MVLIAALEYLERFYWKAVPAVLEVGHALVRMGKNRQVLQWDKWGARHFSTRCSAPRVLCSCLGSF